MLAQLLYLSHQNNEMQDWLSEVNKLDIEKKCLAYNLGSEIFLRRKSYLKEALKYSRIAKDLGSQVVALERDWRTPNYLTDQEVLDHRNKYYARNLAQYGNFLLANNKIDSAIYYIKMAAVQLAKFEIPDLNKLLIETLKKYGENEEAENYLEEIDKDLKSDPFLDALNGNSTTSNNNSISSKSNYDELILLNEPLPFFEFENDNGTLIIKSDLKGKIIVLDFWATWCGPCIAKFNPLYNLQKKYSNNKNIEFYFINTSEKGDNIKERAMTLITNKGLPFKVLFDFKNKAKNKLGVHGLPTLLILDDDSNIRYREEGFDPAKGVIDIERAIEQLLKNK